MQPEAHEGIALIIRSGNKHYEISKYQREFLQATSIQDRNSSITISTVYSSPKHATKENIT
jgi:hypothetical protein